jgi:hypothetical protein
MNLAWLAAVLEPRDVAAHPNFPDDDYDSGGPARLAAVVLGDPWRSHRAAQLAGELVDDPVVLAERCLRSDTIAVSVAELARRLTGPRPDDLAQAAALALIACSAAAELDDYRTCLQVLDTQLRWTPKVRTPDDALLRAALLQQKALRLRDAGQPHLPTSVEAAAAVAQVDAGRCSAFPTGPGVLWSSGTTVEQIRGNLLAAIASLVPIDAREITEAAGLPTWQEQVRGAAPSITVRTAMDRAKTYSDYVGTVFTRQFGSRTRSIIGSVRPDLFYSVLALELVGHGAVYPARKELALLRLVQAGGDPTEMADALRLLRHAAAKNELDLALRRLRAGGPLSVLSHDARQVLRTRTAPELLRTVELRVLRAAAELLAPPEARVALDAIRATLAAGGPPDLPGMWELPVLRKEVAWVAAAALGNACGAAGEVAELLLREAVKERQDDELLDRSLQRAAAEVDWADVPRSVQAAWTKLLRTRAAGLPDTAEVVSMRIGSPAPAPVSPSAMDALVHRLNAALGGEPVDPALAHDGVPLVREALRKIRSDAAKSSYSMGGISAADVAAGLVLVAGAEELWPGLTDFLLDPRVPREDRSPAFERLARADLSLPADVAARLRAHAQQLLATPGPDPFEAPEAPLVPYPSALRFLGAHRLLDDADVYDAVATLAGAANPAGRREAAVTVAVLAATPPRSQLLALALPLARDHDVEVRANAGRALAVLARPEEPLAAVALRRLTELLAEDGLLAPLLVLRALADVPGGLPAAVRRQIEELAAQHPSRLVRAEAGRLLALQDSAGRGEGIEGP